MNDSYFDTLSQAIDGAIIEADRCRALLLRPGEAREAMSAEPISYNQSRRFDFELELYKDKQTKKWFHVVIARLDSGRYELVTYVL
jgi:hypothetical protein